MALIRRLDPRPGPRLASVRPGGKAAQFDAGEDGFFLRIEGGPGGDGVHPGDLLAVSPAADAAPGDLVVWWTGTPASQALARVQDDFHLRAVAGFPPPRNHRGRRPCVRGVVVGALRRMEEEP